jgi:thymidylate kinase
VLRSLGGVIVCSAMDPARLCHVQWWLPTAGTARDGGIVDVTVGDLRVGPLLLLAADSVETASSHCLMPSGVLSVRRFAGTAAVLDLTVRPLLRGRLVEGERLAAARVAFAVLEPLRHTELRRALHTALGRKGQTLAQAWLHGEVGADARARALVPMARRRLVRATLGAPVATWRQRHAVLPSRGARPLGFRADGVVVALVGTDGSGKSSVAEGLGLQLERAGFTVERRYFGMARGNVRWLAALRRLAGGGSVDVAEHVTDPAASAPGSPSLVMRLAAYAYAADYVWRTWRTVRPARRKGAIVLCDRWVTDLHRHPNPGSPAARLAERLAGRPQLFVLADAPVEQIVARKPERTLADAAAEQEGLRELGDAMHGSRARGGGRTRFLVADTSGPKGTAVAGLTAIVITTAHRGLA